MATVDLGGFFRSQTNMAVVGAPATSTLDTNTDFEGCIAVATRAIVVRKVGLWVQTLTGTSPTYRIGLESQADGGSSGVPSGTYLASGNGKHDQQLAAGYNEITLDADVTLAAGDAFAVTVRYQSGTIDASNFALVNNGIVSDSHTNNPGVFVNTGAFTYRQGLCCKTLIDTGGGILEDFGAASETTNQTWNSGSTPLLRGTALTIPTGIDLEVVGIKATIRPGAATNFRFVLWRGTDGASTATTATVDTDVAMDQAITWPFQLGITPTWMLAGETWRFLVEPTNVNSFSTFLRLDFTSAAQRIAAVGDLFYTTGNSGTWADTTAQTIGIVPVIRNIRYRSERVGFGHG